MGYIPEDAKWYLADIVQQITVEDEPRNVVHTNLVLIRADSPEEAYQKAIELGTAGDHSDENIDREARHRSLQRAARPERDHMTSWNMALSSSTVNILIWMKRCHTAMDNGERGVRCVQANRSFNCTGLPITRYRRRYV